MAVDVLNCFLSCLDDYTLDRRGDIGAWVREASMQGLTDIILVVARQDQVHQFTVTFFMAVVVTRSSMLLVPRPRGDRPRPNA